LFDLRIREGWDYFYGRRRNLHLVERVNFHNIFRNKPGVKDPETTEIAIDGMSRESFVLGTFERVGGETPHLLQVGDKRPDFVAGDVGQTHAAWLSTEEPLEAGHARNHDLDRVRTFPLGRGTELVAGDKALWI
jgi:hypothetical protein